MKPLISVIIPVYNEEEHIVKLLNSLYKQTLEHSQYEIIIVDGKSRDKTKERVQAYKKKHPQRNISLIDNPKRRTPYAFNKGIKAAKGNYITIVGAHSELRKDWLAKSLETIQEAPEDVMAIGGRWKNVAGKNKASKAIAYTTSTFWGGGMSSYRYKKEPHYADTVVYGTYKKEVFKKIGLFDTNFLIGQDGELNLRMKKKRYRMYCNPSIIAKYNVRPNFKKFSKQMYEYGKARIHMLHKHKILNIKQCIPLGLLLYFVASIPLLFWSWWFILPIALHLLISIIMSFKKPQTFFHNIAAFSITHVVFGAGMLVGAIDILKGKKTCP